ncbi:MAG: hypothetical protein J5894_03120 [Clostridia bacterium]|nr:hypothetical protein [Clostridia bacterium]
MANEKIGQTTPETIFYNAKNKPFEIYGLYNDGSGKSFCRMPAEVAGVISEGVKHLALETAGGRVRFSTDSQYVAIRTKMPYISDFRHMPRTGTTAFDLYVDTDGGSRYVKTFINQNTVFDGGYEGVCKFEDRKMRKITINFPSYNAVDSLYIGVEKDATVGGGAKYLFDLPVVFYGSSITQGACSSRPGMIYENIISRKYNLDYLNLGFSGSAKGEAAMADYISVLDMIAFVADYDHNAPNAEHLGRTSLEMYEKIRKNHPNIPYILVSRPDFSTHNRYDGIARRDALTDVYREARERGDKKIYFIDGEGIFRGPYSDNCTVDGTHPNDLGMVKIAESIGKVLESALRR